MPPNKDDFKTRLISIFHQAELQGKSVIIIISGDLHRQLGGYPDKNHRMPNCCNVMKQLMRAGDEILQEPLGGLGATLTIRYKLPR